MNIKKLLSLALFLCMLMSLSPAAFAAEGCEHHLEHTPGCGYAPAVEGADCTHVHDELCGYVEAVEAVSCACVETDENGALIHTEGCGYAPGAEGQPCAHSHDDACGYKEAVAEQPCNFVCTDCAAAPAGGGALDAPQDTEPVCNCETDDPVLHYTYCAVYVRPETPVCLCETLCTAETLNYACDVCGVDGADACAGSEGESFGSLPVTGNETSTPSSYTVSFDTNGGAETIAALTTGSDGKLTALPTAPTRQGFSFKGWFSEKTGGDAVTTGTVFSHDSTVYAQWDLVLEHTVDLRDKVFYCGVINSDTVDISTLLPADTKAVTGLESTYTCDTSFFSGITILMAETMDTPWKVTFRTQKTAAAGESTLVATFKTANYGDIKVNIIVKLMVLPADRYIIDVAEMENGTVSASALTAKAGEVITVTVTPKEKYELDTLKYNDGSSDTDIAESSGTYSFVMPAANVTIKAAFKKLITDPVYVGGVALEPGKLYVNDGNGSVKESADGGWNAKLEGDENSGYTLYINGLDVNGVQNTNSGAGIYYGGSGKLTIQATGNNTVNAANSTAPRSSSIAVFADGDLAVTGGGTLSVAGNVPGSYGTSTGIRSSSSMSISGVSLNASTKTNSSTKYSYAVYAFQSLSISDSTITATAQNASNDTVGILASAGSNANNVELQNSSITATGKRAIQIYSNVTISGANTNIQATGSDYGLSVHNGSLTVNGGTVLAKGGTQASYGKVLVAEGLEALASETTDGELSLSYDASQNSSYKAVKISPVPNHTHSWTYSEDETEKSITESCASTDGSCPAGEQKIILSAPGDCVYSGEPCAGAVVSGRLEGVSHSLRYSGEGYDSSEPPVNAGSYTVTLSAGGKSVSSTFKISPKTLTITAQDKTAKIGDVRPSLTYTVTGLIGSDKLIKAPTLKCTADMTSGGSFSIVPEGADAGGNYEISYKNGVLYVENMFDVDIDSSRNGTVSSSHDRAAYGSTVTLSTKGKTGYALKLLEVYDDEGSKLPLKKLGGGKYSFVMPASDVSVHARFRVLSPYESPATGDTANMPLWLGLMALAIGGMGLSGYKLKGRKKEE